MRRRHQVYGLVFNHLRWRAMCFAILLNCVDVGALSLIIRLFCTSERRSLAFFTSSGWAAHLYESENTLQPIALAHIKTVMMSFDRFWAKSLFCCLLHWRHTHFLFIVAIATILIQYARIYVQFGGLQKNRKICIIFYHFSTSRCRSQMVFFSYISMSLDLNCVILCAIQRIVRKIIWQKLAFFYRIARIIFINWPLRPSFVAAVACYCWLKIPNFLIFLVFMK